MGATLLVLALLGPLAAFAAWTPAGAGLEALALPGASPTLLALPGTGSNAAASGSAPRVLVVGDDSPEGLRFVDPDAGVELGALSLTYQPVALAMDSAGSRVYVLTDNASMHVVDVATRTLLSTFVLGGIPKGLLLREASGQVVELLVALNDPNRVVGIDPANGATLRSVDLDRDPAALAWGLGGTRILAGAKSGKLYTLDESNLAVLATAQIGDEIRHLSWWEAGGLAVVVHKRTDGVSLVNVATGQVSGFVALDGDPERSALDAAAARAYVTTHDDFSVNRVNLAGQVLEGRYALPEKAAGVVFDALSAKLLVSQRGDRRLLRLDPAQASLISILQLNKRLRDIAVNNVTHEAVAVADKADELTRIKLADLSTAVVALPARPRYVAVDTALNLAVVGHKNKTLRFVDTAQSPPVLLPDVVTLADEPDALAVDASRNLTVALTDTKRKIHFVSNVSKTLLSTVSLSEDAGALALHAGRGLAYVLTGQKKLLLVNLDTRAVVQTIALEFRGNAIAVDEARDRAVLTTDQDDKAYVLDLATLTPATVSLVEASFAQAHVLPRMPGAVQIQLDSGLAVVASKESNALSSIDLNTGALSAAFATLDKPFALAISSRHNQALVLGAETDDISFVQLANPVPVLEALAPSTAAAGSAAFTLTLSGQRFIEASRVFFGTTMLVTRWIGRTTLEADVTVALLAAPGTVNVTVQNPPPAGGASNALAFTLTQALAIDAISPSSGPVGTLVTISGTGFDPVPASNLLVFSGINGTTVPSPALSASAAQIAVRVPPLADTGPITLANSRGTVQSPPFTVTREQDYQLVVSPGELTVYQSASASAQAQLASTGTKPFTGLAALSVQGLPSGVSASFSPAATLSAFQAGAITFSGTGAAAPGSYPIAVQATFSEGGSPFVRSSSVTLTVAAATGVTGVKGRFVTPEGRGIAGIIARADIAQTPQPQTTSDAAGNFILTGLPAGQVTLRLDATPAHPLNPIWPYTVTLPANQFTLLPDWTIQPPPPDEAFTQISNAAQDQIITDPRFPGLEVKLPAGVTITGWDGVVKTRIAVERHDPDKLGVSPPPIPTSSVFQLYFGTPMGGIPSAPIPITFPNDVGLEPGERTNIWYYDGSPMGGSGEWKIAGEGTVSPDGKVVVPDANAGIPRFCGQCGLGCIQANQNNNPRTPSCPCTTCPCPPQSTAAPVNFFTGQELPSGTDLSISGLIPLELSRSFHPRDPLANIAGQSLTLGFSWSFSYDVVLLPFSGQLVRIILAGNNRADFTPSGTGGFEVKNDTRYYGAKLTQVNSSLWELKFKDGRLWRFQPFGGVGVNLLVEQRDPNGNAVSISRNSSGKILSVQAGERSLSFASGANGFVSEVSDQIGRTVKYAYNAQNVLQTVTLPDNETIQYTYVDDSEFAALPACPAPLMRTRLKTIRMPGQSAVQELFYGPGKRVLREAMPNGEELRFSYKVTGACVTHVSDPALACTANCPSEDSWDNFAAGWRIVGGQVTATTIVDGKGRATTQRFNATGVGTESVDNQGQATKYVRDAQNRVTSVTDALGRVTRFVYDAKGNRIQQTDALGRIIDTAYDPTWNKPTSITRTLNGQPVVRRFEYDAANGNLLKSVDPRNQETRFTYTAQGQLATVLNVALNQTTALEYNPAGDLLLVRDPLGNESLFEPDAVGRTVGATDPLRASTLAEYNTFDQVTRITDAREGLTQFEFDAKRDLRGVVNPLARTIEAYAYDARHRLVKKTDARLKDELYTYDANGNLGTVTDRKGQATGFAYDAQNRLARLDYAGGVSQTRQYDAVGRLTEIREPEHAMTYAYDEADRLVRESTESANGRTEVAYEYDALDRRTGRTVTLNGVLAEETSYAYDEADRLLAQTHRAPALGVSTPRTVSYVWDEGNRLAQRTLPNGVRQAFSYDGANRITGIEYRGIDDTLIESLAYSYDAAGQRLTKTTGSSSVPETAFGALYDEANRLTSLTLTATGQSFTLAYDDNGNLVTKTEQANPANLTTYTWDSRNRLTGIAAPGVTASFGYDALGRRSAKTVNGQTVGYVYDGAQAVGEIANGQVSATLLTGLALDEALARFTQAGARSLLTDALSSVLAQTRDDQSIQNYYAYSPYGETVALGPDEGNPIQYTGRENDGTGLYYYRARYYDPVLKRFVSEDPIGINGGLNVYAYADENPASLIDPDGLMGNSPGGGRSAPGPVRFGGGSATPLPKSLAPFNSISVNFGYGAGVSASFRITPNGLVPTYIGIGAITGLSVSTIVGLQGCVGDPSGIGIRASGTAGLIFGGSASGFLSFTGPGISGQAGVGGGTIGVGGGITAGYQFPQ